MMTIWLLLLQLVVHQYRGSNNLGVAATTTERIR